MTDNEIAAESFYRGRGFRFLAAQHGAEIAQCLRAFVGITYEPATALAVIKISENVSELGSGIGTRPSGRKRVENLSVNACFATVAAVEITHFRQRTGFR